MYVGCTITDKIINPSICHHFATNQKEKKNQKNEYNLKTQKNEYNLKYPKKNEYNIKPKKTNTT